MIRPPASRARHLGRCPPTARARLVLASLLLVLASAAHGQTLAEVTLVAAISSTLHPGLALPAGSFRAEGPGAAQLISSIPGAEAWTDWEVYTLGGLVAALEGAVLYGAERDLMAAGFFKSRHEERAVGEARHVRLEFDGEGGRALVYLIRAPDALVWLLARSR